MIYKNITEIRLYFFEIQKRKKENIMGKLSKKREGITLIALVVTIVVLLILAGVSIAMLTGDNRNT